MYINDVIRLVDQYCPSEYDLREKYTWCDEVSSMLIMEDNNIYKKVVLPIAQDGTILLPDGVNIEYVDNITIGNTALNKTDFRTYGRRTISIKGRNQHIDQRQAAIYDNKATVTYITPFEPLRLTKYRGSIALDKLNNTFTIHNCEFIPGDILIIQIDSSGSDPQILQNIPLLSVSYDQHSYNDYICIVPDGSLNDITVDTDDDTIITRVVTEKTACEAPFDTMYIDYLLAKINWYQRDIEAYNQYMTAFNSRLSAYKNWINGKKTDGEAKLINWW